MSVFLLTALTLASQSLDLTLYNESFVAIKYCALRSNVITHACAVGELLSCCYRRVHYVFPLSICMDVAIKGLKKF